MSELYGNRIQTTTDKELMPAVVDTVLEDNVLMGRFLRAAKKWKGRTLEIPFKHTKDTQGGAFRGLQTLDAGLVDNVAKLEFTPSWNYKPVSLAMDEMSVNNVSETQVIDLLGLKVESTTQDLADDIGTQFYGSNAADDKKFLGLADHVDDGNTVATYGGQSRSTYTGLQSTVTAAASNQLTVAQMDTMWNAVSSGSIQPSVIATTPTVRSLYEQLLRPQERIYKEASKVKMAAVGTGATSATYRGVEVLADDKCTSGVMFFLTESEIDFYAVPVHPMFKSKPVAYRSVIKGNNYSDVEGLGFSYTPWRIPANQMGATMQILLGGQFVCRNPKRQGKLTGITSIA